MFFFVCLLRSVGFMSEKSPIFLSVSEQEAQIRVPPHQMLFNPSRFGSQYTHTTISIWSERFIATKRWNQSRGGHLCQNVISLRRSAALANVDVPPSGSGGRAGRRARDGLTP